MPVNDIIGLIGGLILAAAMLYAVYRMIKKDYSQVNK